MVADSGYAAVLSKVTVRSRERGDKEVLPVLKRTQVDDVYEDVKLAAFVAALHGHARLRVVFNSGRSYWSRTADESRFERSCDKLTVTYAGATREKASQWVDEFRNAAAADGFSVVKNGAGDYSLSWGDGEAGFTGSISAKNGGDGTWDF